MMVLQIRERAFGDIHPDTADSCSNLAVVCREQGKDQEAEALFQKALTAYEKIFGPNHPDTQAVCGELAALSESRGEE